MPMYPNPPSPGRWRRGPPPRRPPVSKSPGRSSVRRGHRASQQRPLGHASQRRSPLRPRRESENLLVRKLHQLN